MLVVVMAESNGLHKRLDSVLLRIDHVSLTLGGKLILRDVCADVTNSEGVGEVIAFLGPSGIGKTQLSRVIAGLQAPSSGQVLLRGGSDGGNLNLVPTGPGKVCMVPQNYPMFEYATVSNNLYIAGKQAGLSNEAINAKASTYIKAFGLESYLHVYPSRLSGGTRQRVAIARQLMCASNYLVLDEPFSGLDPIMKRRAMDAIVTLSLLDTYNTIIVVSHDVTEAMSIADRVWLMGLEKGFSTREDAKAGFIPGARLIEQYDLAAEGLAWQPGIEKNPKFQDFVLMVKDKFQTLS